MDQVKTLANNLGFDAFCIQTIITSTESSFNVKRRILKTKKNFIGLKDAKEIGNEKEVKYS